MRAMIALVSEQRMQNVIPCYQAGAAYAEVHLVRSLQADDPGLPHARARLDTIGVLEQVTPENERHAQLSCKGGTISE
ncbi:MAG: hypothetical protein HPY58_12575 [Firmicutes bacterium]|nr:hypothetical protein [Bacillota bacterium]